MIKLQIKLDYTPRPPNCIGAEWENYDSDNHRAPTVTLSLKEEYLKSIKKNANVNPKTSLHPPESLLLHGIRLDAAVVIEQTAIRRGDYVKCESLDCFQ